jgi:hypothetical protein
MQARAWTYANARVVEHISLMVTMSNYRQQFIELKFEDRLSVADAVVLEHHLGLTKTANFVAEVDPWCYPHDDSPTTIGVKNYVQSVVNKAAHSFKKKSDFTDESITEFLLSPLLLKQGDRPSLVRHKSKAQRSTSSSRTVVTAAATVARKPSSPAVDLPTIDQGKFFMSPCTYHYDPCPPFLFSDPTSI